MERRRIEKKHKHKQKRYRIESNPVLVEAVVVPSSDVDVTEQTEVESTHQGKSTKLTTLTIERNLHIYP